MWQEWPQDFAWKSTISEIPTRGLAQGQGGQGGAGSTARRGEGKEQDWSEKEAEKKVAEVVRAAIPPTRSGKW